MKVLIDGKEVKCLTDVKVIYPDVLCDDNDGTDLHIAVTSEGVIYDLVKDGKVIDTACYNKDDIAAELEE